MGAHVRTLVYKVWADRRTVENEVWAELYARWGHLEAVWPLMVLMRNDRLTAARY